MTVQVDNTADCQARLIGPGSRVMAFARLGPAVTVGQDCVVGDRAVLDGEIALANGVQVSGGARLIGPVAIGARASIGINAILSATENTSGAAEITVGADARIGAAATVLPGVSIGRGAVIKPGSIVMNNVPAHAIVSGNPARIVAYVESVELTAGREQIIASDLTETTPTRVRGVTIQPLTHARDLRGSLTALEFEDLPFAPARAFSVFGVPSEFVRGSHAHRTCAQFFVCLAGELSCLVDDGTMREEIRLGTPDVGVHMPPMTWGTQWKYTRDAVLLVLASHPYDPADYIHDYEEFLELLNQHESKESASQARRRNPKSD
jgi:acetyltransferase-like isoleucine patch superfamily enzyme